MASLNQNYLILFGPRAAQPVVDLVSEEQWLGLVLVRLGPEDSLGHTPPPS